jgi:hypothetical protein
VIGGAQAVCFRVYAPVVFVFFVEVGKLVGKSPSTELKDVRKTRITSGIINIEKELEYHSSNTQ